jgi:hypothetical protein
LLSGGGLQPILDSSSPALRQSGHARPTLAEGLELAQTHDLPGVGQTERFWTGDRFIANGTEVASTVTDDGTVEYGNLANLTETVCVTTPTN